MRRVSSARRRRHAPRPRRRTGRFRPGNKNTLSFTLNCGSAGTVDAVFELSSSDSFHIVQFSSNFLWKSLDYVTPDGQTGRIERGINGGGHSGLVTCTYIGAVSGNHYIVTGFFTP